MEASMLAVLETRLARLEQQNRRLRGAVGAALAVCSLLVASQAISTPPAGAQPAPRTVTAERFQLHDPETGTTRGAFQIDPRTGNAEFFLVGPAERGDDAPHVFVSANARSAGLSIIHGPTEAKISLRTTMDNVGQLIIRDDQGTPVFQVP